MSRPRTPQRITAPRRRLPLVLAASASAVALVVGVSTVAMALASNDDDRVVATIDGADVTRAELLFHMQRVRAGVENSARSDAAAADADLRDAALRDAALDEIEGDRALTALAREHGLAAIDTFADLRRATEATNTTRGEQAAHGEVVYGLTSFSVEEFHSRTMTELRTALIDALSKGADPELAVTDAEVEQYLAEHAREWAAGATTYRATRLELPEQAAFDEQAAAALAHAPGGLEAAASAVPGASVSPVEIDAEGRIGDLALSPDALAQLRTLAPGETTTPQTHRGGWAVYRLDETSVDAEAALATYATRIRAVLVEERFEALVAERRAQQTTELSPTEWNAVKMEGITR